MHRYQKKKKIHPRLKKMEIRKKWWKIIGRENVKWHCCIGPKDDEPVTYEMLLDRETRKKLVEDGNSYDVYRYPTCEYGWCFSTGWKGDMKHKSNRTYRQHVREAISDYKKGRTDEAECVRTKRLVSDWDYT